MQQVRNAFLSSSVRLSQRFHQPDIACNGRMRIVHQDPFKGMPVRNFKHVNGRVAIKTAMTSCR
jgi:hypothetical protein